MTFTPIPGVWYRPQNGTSPRYLYAPRTKNDEMSWYDIEMHQWYAFPRCEGWPLEPADLVEGYNPHPPTRTLWGISADGEDPDGDDITPNKLEALDWLRNSRERYAANTWRLVKSQLSDWAEVNDAERL